MSFAGPSPGETLYDWVSQVSTPMAVGGGMPSTPSMTNMQTANANINLLRNVSFETGWSSGTTSAPDGWTLTGAGAAVLRDTDAADIQDGLASVRLTPALDTAADLGQSLTISTTQNTRLRGKLVTLSAWVKCGTAARAFLKLDDGVTVSESEKHPGDSTFRQLVCRLVIDGSATKIEASLEMASGTAISGWFDSVKLEEGDAYTAFAAHRDDSFMQPRVLAQAGTDTTSSTTMVDLTRAGVPTEIANVIVDGNQSVLVFFRTFFKGTNPYSVNYQILRDATVVNTHLLSTDIDTTGFGRSITFADVDVKPAAGNYTYSVQWQVGDAAATGSTLDRVLSIAIIPSA